MTSHNLRIADSPLFDGLQSHELEQIESATTIQELDSDEVLFDEGDEGHHLYIVKSGLLGIYLKDHNGRQVQVETRGNRSVVGEMSCLTGEPRSATVRALLPTELLAISGEDFMSVAKSSPTLLLNINRVLAQRLRDASRSVIRHKGEIVLLIGGLPSAGGQWLAQNLSIAIAEVGAKYTMLLNPNPLLDNIPKLPSRLSIQSFLDGVEHLPEARPGAAPLKTVLALEPERTSSEANGVLDFSSFHEAIGRGALVSDYIIVNLTSLNPDAPHSLLSVMTPELMSQVAQVVWVAEGDRGLKDQAEQARRLMDTFNLPHDKISWLLLKDNPKQNQGERIAWENELGSKLVSVVPVSGANELLEGSSWADGDVWKSLLEAGRHICHRTVGVAFGGGGARGFAHIGVIRGFEDIGLPVDYIAGTSAGSMIGGLWALGNTSEALKDSAERFKKSWKSRQLFIPTLPFRSLLWGKGLRGLVESLVGESTFDDTLMPFGAVASQSNSGRRVVFRTGRMSTALIASSSIPVVFPPFRLNGRLLVDGGQVEPVPVPTLKMMGADKVIAINFNAMRPDSVGWQPEDLVSNSTDSGRSIRERAPNILGAYFNVFEALRDEVAHNAVMSADVCIRPDFESRKWYEISRMNEFIESGHKAVLDSKEEIECHLPWLNRKGPGAR